MKIPSLLGKLTYSILIILLLISCTEQQHDSQAPSNAKNVILFIGDGMGISTITAARIFDGQSRGESGEENQLSFESFPNVALVKTYNTNQQVPDSAGTATAMHTGVKTRAGVISVGPEALRRSCSVALQNQLPTIGEIATAEGLNVGIVTTTRVTHATPATLYAHSPERNWENDGFLSDNVRNAGCKDIARQLVELSPVQAPAIVLGGGLREFKGSGVGGKRKTVEEDLIAQWLKGDANRHFINTRQQLKELKTDQQIMGLFTDSHMTYMAQRPAETPEPTLQEMTAAAIDYLQAKDQGYYLLVEGGRIDHAHHAGKPGYAMMETQAFAQAVAVALEKVDLQDTLILVTADHSHVFTLSGYPTRGNPILGLVVGNDESGQPQTEPYKADDGQPYTSVGYSNGPGAVSGPRLTPQTDLHAVAQALVPFASETHGGEDVALYAIGNGSEQVRGVIEQNKIFDIMMAAYGWMESD